MPSRRMYRRRARRVRKSTRGKVSKSIKRYVKRAIKSDEPPKWLALGINNVNVGTAHGVVGTGTFAMNDYTIQGAHIAQGTASYQRIGDTIRLKRLHVKLFPNMVAGSRMRVIICKGREPGFANLTTNDLIGTAVETTTGQVFMATTSGAPLLLDQFRAANTSLSSVFDQTYVNPDSSATQTIPICFSVDLNIKREYAFGGTVNEGSWFMWIASTATNAMYGSVKLEFSDGA